MLYYNCKGEIKKGKVKTTFRRECTNKEIEIYNKVEKVVKTMTNDEFTTFIDVISKRVFDYTANKSIYNKAYRMAKKYGLVLNEVETWYCID